MTFGRPLLSLLLASVSITSAYATPLKVGISLVDLSNPFFTILAEEITHNVKQQYPDEVDILMHSSAYNLSKQIAQLDDFIEKEIDIIFVAASETEAIAPFVSRAREKGIIVVAVDIESSGADIIVTSDNLQAGQLACDYLAQQIDYRGDIAIINGQKISSVMNRVTGCHETLKRYPEITLVSDSHNSSGTYSGGLESMTYLLIEHPSLKGVFTINDPSAFGALEATYQLMRQDIKITSVDASPEFLAQIKANRHSNFVASTAQFPRRIAHRAVELALERWQEPTQKSQTELIPTKLVTSTNVKAFADWQQQP